MNKEILKKMGVSEIDFLKWCKDNHKPAYKKSTQKEFISKVAKGSLVKNQYGEVEKKNG